MLPALLGSWESLLCLLGFGTETPSCSLAASSPPESHRSCPFPSRLHLGAGCCSTRPVLVLMHGVGGSSLTKLS